MRGRPKAAHAHNLDIERTKKAMLFANDVIENHMTIRQIAKAHDVSKSTVYSYITKYIKSAELHNKLNTIWKNNFNTKHIRGGESTKKMYTHMNHID